MPNTEFNFICKSCNRTNGRQDAICDVLEFLLPAFRHACYYSDDITDMVSDDYLSKFIGLFLKEIRKKRFSLIPNQFYDDWASKDNISYKQLNVLMEKVKATKLIIFKGEL